MPFRTIVITAGNLTASIVGIVACVTSATPAAAQRVMDTRWLETVRENVLTLQERHRERIMAVEDQRLSTPSETRTTDIQAAEAPVAATDPAGEPE
jgi:hypothetical protein